MGRETPSIWSTRRDSDGVDMPRNPATIWVSKTVAGTAPQAAMQHVEVLRRRVGHRDAGSAEDRGQRRGVDGERVDQRHLVGPGDLDQGQIGDVGALGVELGVEAVVVLAATSATRASRPAVVDHHVGGRRRCVTGVPTAPHRGPVALVFAAGGLARWIRGSYGSIVPAGRPPRVRPQRPRPGFRAGKPSRLAQVAAAPRRSLLPRSDRVAHGTASCTTAGPAVTGRSSNLSPVGPGSNRLRPI